MSRPQKLLLKCDLSPGDLVMLTAAVRDLHACYPGKFQTDVRTLCPDVWEHNPHLTPLNEDDAEVETIHCVYPLIDHCDRLPYHCLHGFIDFLNTRLCLRVLPTRFCGDIHLSAQEKAWYSQIHELTGEETPYWVMTAGGKYDVTTKWWSPERYQKIVDHFRGRVVFVQVGQRGHHHPRLDGTVDLRGQTTLRQLIRLVYHAQGVLSPITCLMHLAAAVEAKHGSGTKPCVVVAGGREPAHWEQYPGHQFIHTIGALRCCARSGCWKDRVVPLGDGDERDQPERLCEDVVNGLPRCLDLIKADEVIQRIETYFQGGMLPYLSKEQWAAASRAIDATATNPFDREPLTVSNARVRWEDAIRRLTTCPDHFQGRGIVICAGGCRLFTNMWVNVNLLRQHGCTLPIQVWHLGEREMTPQMRQLLQPLGVECVDGLEMRKTWPSRILGGWELKCYAMLHAPFEEMLFLDADNMPVANPEYLFDAPEFRQTGAVFWPDIGVMEHTEKAWRMLGCVRPSGVEFESGQMLVNKRQCWKPLSLAMWLNENSDFFNHYLHGDKETFHIAFRKLGQPFTLISALVKILPGTMCQHDLEGRRIFQHRNTDKWNLFASNRAVPDFWFESDCRQHLKVLQRQWDSRTLLPASRREEFGPLNEMADPPTIQAGMISCATRAQVRQETLRGLAATDWGENPVLLELDDEIDADPRERQQRCALRLLKKFLEGTSDYLLFLEDDLEFNQSLRHNISQWGPIRSRRLALGSLYNPGLMEEACDVDNRVSFVRPDMIYGSQAFIISREAVAFITAHWEEMDGMQDIRISRLAGRFKPTVYYHSPSLVQHVGTTSTWGGNFHEASDFDAYWRALKVREGDQFVEAHCHDMGMVGK